MAKKDTNKSINDIKKELYNLRVQKKNGQLTDISQFKKLKKDIARKLTMENHKNA